MFLIGAHNGLLPRDPSNVRDIEISQFIVALTRTRKQCHIVSNKWMVPVGAKGFISPFKKSDFISWIPPELIKDLGALTASTVQ